MTTKFIRMPLGNPEWLGYSPRDVCALEALGVDWGLHSLDGVLPPLDDYSISHCATFGFVPEWIVDGVECVRRFGGQAYRPDDIPSGAKGPWISKPNWNPHGLADCVQEHVFPLAMTARAPGLDDVGMMFQPLYVGQHMSEDIAIRDGEALWKIVAAGNPRKVRLGQFKDWIIFSGSVKCTAEEKRRYASALPEFSGVINVETIGGHITEVHFRPSLEFFPLYGDEGRPAILRAASGEPTNQPKNVPGGTILVEPRDAVRIKVKRDLDERSWRRSLIYLEGDV